MNVKLEITFNYQTNMEVIHFNGVIVKQYSIDDLFLDAPFMECFENEMRKIFKRDNLTLIIKKIEKDGSVAQLV